MTSTVSRTTAPATAGPTQTAPNQQELLNQFYTSAQSLKNKIDQTPGLRDRLDDDLKSSEFLLSLDRLANMDGSTADVQALQKFLTESLGVKNIGTADGKVGRMLVQGLQQALPKLNAYQTSPTASAPAALPTVRPSHSSNPLATTFPDSTVTTPQVTPVRQVSPPVQPAADTSSAEAQAAIGEIAAAITARYPSKGGQCYAGAKHILSLVDDVARASQLDPKSKQYKSMLAKYPGLKSVMERLHNNPQLAEKVGKGTVLAPPNKAASAYMANDVLGGPNSPYQVYNSGSQDNLTEADLRDPTKFPPGSIVVWDRSPLIEQSQSSNPAEKKAALKEIARLKKNGDWGRGHPNGHIAFVGPAPANQNERRFEYSDKRYGFNAHYAGGNFTVYTLK